MKRIAIASLAAALLLLGTGPAVGTAQSPDEYQVVVPLAAINQPVFSPGVPNLGVALKSITALADGQPCATVGIANAVEDRVLHFSMGSAFDACSREGATVTFRDGNNLTLATSFTLRKGARDVLSNLAPLPPGSSGPAPSGEQLPTRSDEFQVLVQATRTQMVIPVNPAPAQPFTIGGQIGTLTAWADGVECTSLDVSNLREDALLRLGTEGQPEACSTEGATVTFTNSRGMALMGSMTLRLGSREILQQYAPAVVPPAVVEPPARVVNDVFPDPAPAPETPRRGSVTPPDTGDAGLR